MVYNTEKNFLELDAKIEEIIDNIDLKYFKENRWFQSKADLIESISVKDYCIILKKEDIIIAPVLLEFNLINILSNNIYSELYYVPLVISLKSEDSINIWLEIKNNNFLAFVYDGVFSMEYISALENLIDTGKTLNMVKGGYLETKKINKIKISESRSMSKLNSNSITYIKKEEIIKTYRRLVRGINPDLELGLYLYRDTEYRNYPVINAYVKYLENVNEEYDLSISEEYIPNQGNAWEYTQNYLSKFFQFIQEAEKNINIKYIINDYLKEISKIGETVARLHLALSRINKKGFFPEAPRKIDLEKWYAEVLNNIKLLLGLLEKEKINILNTAGDYNLNLQKYIEEILLNKEELMDSINLIFDLKDYMGKFIRIHGDLHLQQILKTDRDYIIIDFEGEPLNSIEKRRRKFSPLKDIASMLRSLNYASYSEYINMNDSIENYYKEDFYHKAALIWEKEASKAFLSSYIYKVKKENGYFLPPQKKLGQFISLYKMEKVIYEGIYEINNRPEWVILPIKGIIECMKELY
jgi:maltokinase